QRDTVEILLSHMGGHDALEKCLAIRPIQLALRCQFVNLADLHGREGTWETGGRAGGKDQLQRIGERAAPFQRNLGAKSDRQTMLAFLHHWRAVEPQQLDITAEVGGSNEQVERMPRR